MSLDGSFVPESALRRFLARFPNLASHRKLAALSEKCGSLTADDIVTTIADPFFHPSYTIPIIGCFRPLSKKIVDTAVSKLQKVISLELKSDFDGDEIGEDDIYVIDFYVGRGRRLRLHELASMAFCRALDMAPFLLSSVSCYFGFSPPPFRRICSIISTLNYTKNIFYFMPTDARDVYQLLDAVRTSYRFLLMEPKVFSELWDWSCFFDLIEQTASLDLGDAVRASNIMLDIRWCAIQILSVVLQTSDRANESFGMKVDEAFTCLLRWEEFCQDTSLEKAGCYLQANQVEYGSIDEAVNFSQCVEFFKSDSSSNYHIFKSHSRSNMEKSSCYLKLSERPFILTSTVKKSFEMIFMAIDQKWPVLLHGPAGAGKTALINKLACASGKDVLFIHMDEQMDSKTLIGSYVCGESPGEFIWQPGSLTQAILKGFWVVFEDIDKAPNEVQSVILPLLEGSSSFVTGHGEVVHVGETFRLFATITTSKLEINHGIEGKFSFSALWRKVMVWTANKEDMIAIVDACYPSLKYFSSELIDTFEKVNDLASYQLWGTQSGEASAVPFRRFSIRDLLKWCKRISDLGLSFSVTGLSASDRQIIFPEAVDIFAASIPSVAKRLLIMGEIAKWLGAMAQVDNLFLPRTPTQPLDIEGGCTTFEPSQTAVRRPFVGIRSSLHVLERIKRSVKHDESVLLVGETGTGKTTLVQHLAALFGRSLIVMNLSQQSDAADLLGGFKPTDARSMCISLYREFEKLFCRTFSRKGNEDLLRHCDKYIAEKKWEKLLRACQKASDFVNRHLVELDNSGCGSKRKRPLSAEDHNDWVSFASKCEIAQKRLSSSSGMLFKFVEGAFISALRNGNWILLDEVNLAPPEVLQRIIGVLDGETLCLAERGDVQYVDRHEDFRLFACMNPATDAGKRELPYSFRSRFSEYFVDDVLDDADLTLFVNKYMAGMQSSGETISGIVRFYKAAKKESEERLQDGANQKPQFSLRSLARALEYTKKAQKNFGFPRAIYDGFCMFFLTLLDGPSAKIMNNMILSYLLGGIMPERDMRFSDYFIDKSKVQHVLESDNFMKNYVLTRSVEEHLKNLARAIYIKRYPVLLQGPTSSGKTSLVKYLATLTGHEFVRINNHEHTDLQEYLGSYITDSQGQLQFQEGVLVKAVRKGQWIVLDELNLAPSDVLEALNRLLDDNREIFVPELQETVPAHPDFMLFATQNPPMLYGGRKVLSRAFRNRFLEIHIDEIPEHELGTILEKRCSIPPSYAAKMVEVMKDLQLHRQNSKVFAGKHGFITPRDLFRWANRFRKFGKSYEDLAIDGYLLLAERLRDENEKSIVLETLQRRLRVKLIIDDLYKVESIHTDAVSEFAKHTGERANIGNITWTKSMWKLFFLVERCYKLREPVLLVGETGGGKTTVCQLLSIVLGARLHILNCHQYTETSDFIGGFCPVRDRSIIAMNFRHRVELVKQSKVFCHFSVDTVLSTDITLASSTIDQLNKIARIYKQDVSAHVNVSQEEFVSFTRLVNDLLDLQQKWQSIFIWQDGPLVQAMKGGDLFLVDEISLADDSVLERLNSVLEPERKLSLPEKGGAELDEVTAHPNFFILATMNPGGDYGKKELSPALRNRFTEIWVSPVSDVNELKSIAVERFIKSELSYFADYMLKFWQWFNQLQTGRTLTVRDLLSWISFMNVTVDSLGPQFAFIHGVFLVLLDGLSLGSGISKSDARKLRESSLSFLVEELKVSGSAVDPALSKMESYGWGDAVMHTNDTCSVHLENFFGVKPSDITKGHNDCGDGRFKFLAPTTCQNALRVLRGMQLPKPVLLEGSPGVGKTSLVLALAKYWGQSVVRINLSEQTDMMDLLGSDLPVEGDDRIEFSWSDGILLQALKNGSWVLLDELNLAPQSVLEGLNAILDHRAEVYIPELGSTFKCPPSFRVFACQNPSSQGGGRKGLPRSFLNRFTKVYVDELSANDYCFICKSLHPSISETLLWKLISFNNRLCEDTMILHKYGQEGSPWEFNLRDILRSCQIIEGTPGNGKVESFLNIIYLQRMRNVADREFVMRLYEEVFGVKPFINQSPPLSIDPHCLTVGSACVARNHIQPIKCLKNQLRLLPGILHSLEAAAHCVQHQWLCILVGPYSSGKTSLVRLLSQLTGNALIELNLSSATDVSELLGCFEQYDSFRAYKTVICQVEQYVDEYFALRSELAWRDLIIERKDLYAKWFSFLKAGNSKSSMSTSVSRESLDLLVKIIEQLKHDYEKLKYDLEKFNMPVPWSYEDLNKTLKTVFRLRELQKEKEIQPSAKFEWVAGDLIKAIEYGQWVVLKNANLCTPTVLDRINSLVEPERSITVNECGLVNGKPVVLSAHSKFRMFLTVDPKYGEVSRAMRNRGLEIFMMQPNWQANGGQLCHFSEINDVERFLVLSGILFSKLVSAMSEAHMYAKTAGLDFGVRITFLELTRWVQLFQQLLMNGNQPTWSLQISWEHTYLSSLGEVKGRDIISKAKQSYLKVTEWDRIEPTMGCSLSLPGGWPTPHILRNFLCFSREACIKQNCMYLQYLGAQCAAFGSSTNEYSTITFDKRRNIKPPLVPVNRLRDLLSLDSSVPQNYRSSMLDEFNLRLKNQMLFIAANWTFEQATENDIALYILWFKWYNVQLQPHCRFFESFLQILEQEREHPILGSWREAVSNNKMLCSMRLMELAVSDESPRESQKRLDIAVESVCILRQTYQQWNTEMDYLLSGKVFPFRMLPLLYILRFLESVILKVIVDSRELFEIYSKLLEYHIMFWKSITSSHFEHLSVIWSCMKKEAIKLHSRFPEIVGALIAESLNLKNTMAFIINTEKPALWVHGGHPLLPSSPDMYRKIQQLLSYSNSIWPRTKQEASPDAHSLVDILSANVDLRQLVMEAVCMSSFIIAKGDQDDCEPSHQVEELYQRLCIRFEHDRRNLEKVFGSSTKFRTSSLRSTCSTCCTFSPEILCRKSGFESWVVTLPLFDKRSISLDIFALQKLSKCTFVDLTEVHEKVCNSSAVLRRALNYSLNFASRSPVDFVPHQMILWILDAWCSVDSVRENVNSMVLEMWFKWHSSLWSLSSQMFESPSWGAYGKSSQLLHLRRSTTLDKIIQVAMSVKDFEMKCLMLRVASRNLWEDSLLHEDLISILWSLADSLFRQIIFVHKKFFQEKDYEKVLSILSQHKDGITLEELQDLKSCIALSSHGILTSLVDTIIEPLLEELYFRCQSSDFIYNLGCAWWHIGMLRFHLLLNSSGPELPDPAMKYAFKYSRIQEKLSSLELEIKVRRECERLAGRSSDDEKQRLILLQELEKERKRIKAKLIFRPTPSKYKNLRSECLVFMKVVSSFMELVKNLRYSEDVPSVIKEACNWQVTSTSFINKLSEDYADYVDLCQPIQVAVYEMKLGLSIAVSDAVEKEYLKKVNEKSTKRILDTLYSLMQFPRDLSAGLDSETIQPNLVCVQNAAAVIQVIDDNLLNNLVAESNDINPDNVVSVIHLQAISILIHLAHYASSSVIVDKVLFTNLNKMFDRCASLWIDMKSKMKAKEDCEAQYYKFRPRSIKIEDIFGGDLCTLDMPELDGNMTSVHEESSSEHIFIERQPAKDDENIEEEWDQVPESVFNGLVLVHNRLFGSLDLVEHPGLFQLSDEERLYFFLESYRLGARIVKDMPSLQSSILDDSLVPEHLLHICLEYEQTMGSTSLTTKAYNVYKDSNAAVMFEMVTPLVAIQEKVQSFLVDSPGHPRLEEVLETTKTLLAMPLDTPLSKALLVLHLLVSRAHLLQESHSGISLSDQLQPIYALVSSWQKLELESWPALLTGVLEQYEINARKLWFPLHALLHRKPSGDYIMITMQSVEDFILTSTAGEFKKRLHLLLAFHGQLNCGICLGAYSNCHMRESLDILYNAFGYYVQFMPLVSEYIEAGRRSIEKELKEYLKIFNWEHPNNYSSVESFRRSRQKIWKLIKKFNDILQQPLMGILNQEEILRREKDPDCLDKIISVEPNSVELQCPIDLADISTEKFLWCHNWRNKADSALQRMIHESTSGIADLIRNSLASGVICDNFMTIWEEGWTSLEMICRRIAEFAHLWKCGTKNLKKRRAFGDLLKILEGCGLSRHSSMVSEVKLKSGQSSSFFLQSSYNVLHLLQKYSLKSDSFSVRRCCQKPSDDSGTSQWEAVNRYYFSSVAMVQQLRQVCLNFQKDLSLEQVNRAASFVDHLIIIQQDQRRVAYGVSDQLKTLRHYFDCLGSIEMDGNCSLPSNQHAIRKCMWQQKNIFDKLLAMTKDMRLLLLHVKNTHLSSCDRVMREANMMFDFIDKLIPSILLSKESLDKYLIGSDGAVTTANPCVPLVVSENMERLVVFNFNTLGILKENIEKFYMQKASTENVEGHLLNRLHILVVEGKRVEEDFNSQLRACNQSNSGDGSLSELNAVAETVVEMNKLMINVLGKLGHIHTNHFVGELSENITMWKDIFDSHIKNLHLGHICDALNKTITVLSKLANCAVTGANSAVLSQIRTNLAHSRVLLDLLLTFVEGFLFEFLHAHKKIAGMSRVLAHVFILLFSKGFGHAEDLAKDMACDGLQDECGTGMGEGEGINDVSDQIDDESQLLGASDKQDGVNSSNRVPSNKDKGIEMDEDFAADTFSVSEDSGDEDEEDGEDINLEAQMGETGDGNQVVDEKQWDKDKDDRPENSAEKYEPGPSVKEINAGDRELRAKEDGTLMVEEKGELGSDVSDPLSEEDNKHNTSEDDNADDMEMDKKDAFEDPTGIQFDLQEPNSEPNSEDENMEEPQASDAMEDISAALDGEMESEGEEPNPSDHMDDESSMQIEKNIVNEEDATMDLESSKENIESDKLESAHPAQGVDSDDPIRDSNKVDSGVEPEMHWSNSDDTNNGLTPSRTSVGDETAMMELSVPSRDGSRSAADQPKPHSSLDETPFVQRTQTNPYRSIGDAMEEWKERVKVSDDPQEQQLEGSKDLDDENADEYRYVSEVEMGTSQVLGPAVSDQLNCNSESKKSEGDDDHIRKKENVDRLDGVKENHETQHVTSRSASFPRQKINEELLDAVSVGTSTEKLSENDRNTLSGDIVSFKDSYMREKDMNCQKMIDVDVSKSMDVEASDDSKQNAIVEWRRYELLTTKLSQELAEQLRLIMEPTLASKLQGDYRTGKRINMKKVIPYIASHFRKDKIWLRRTKPNKRAYQVVVAIDDSRSMSESHCGNIAIEALITVCRAMSQLEVGQFAVSSFGGEGNIKILHNFDQPFTGETGVKMISNLSFKQDNTITDEPVVDLLKFFNNMLDGAVTKARMPSGQNPLHQLVLIIADGLLHEKEKLKRCVRDFLNRKRMVALILLDNPQESIVDHLEASFEDGKPSITKYLDSFPFPYYIVVKNIETLPRTLADLLRQWFELMQRAE